MYKIQNKNVTYIKDIFVSNDQALISVRDRGFRFGDGIFETIRVNNGSLYQFPLHLQRLNVGLSDLKINFATGEIIKICQEIISRNELENGFVRIAISRGEGGRGYLPEINAAPTLVIETFPESPAVSEPISLWVSNYRKIPPICLPPAAKTMQGLSSTLARMEARDNNCFESLLLDVDGNICEGSSSNIFWFKDNKLFTPALENGVLPGIIRSNIIRLSPYKIIEGIFTLDDLQNAEEVFLSNTAWLALAVNKLISSDKPAMGWAKFNIAAEFKNLILEDMGKAA